MRTIGMLFVIVAMQFHSLAGAQAIKISPARLRAPDDTTRMAAFYEMAGAADEHDRHPQAPPTSFLAARAMRQPDLAIALIDLLEREDAVVAAAPPGSLSAGYLGDYYVDLLVTVARMNDPRSLEALLPGLGTSGVVRTTVAGFGEPAVAPVVRTLRRTDRDERVGAVLTMRQLLTDRGTRPLSDAGARTLRDALVGILASREDAFTRVSAVEALMFLEDDGIRAQMERAAATDTTTGYARPGQPTPFPVRAAARKWLAVHKR